MFVGFRRHREWVVCDIVVGSSSGRHFQLVWPTEVDAFKDWLQFPVNQCLVHDGHALRLLCADRRHDAVDFL